MFGSVTQAAACGKSTLRRARPDTCWLLQLEVADLEPYLANVSDKALKHSLQYGVGFLHETMSSAEQEIVNRLFNNGAIQVRQGSSC